MCYDCELERFAKELTETKSQQYQRQSEEALNSIRQLPHWAQRNMGIEPEMVKIGSSLELRLCDVWGRIYYTEPFTFETNWAFNIEHTLEAFETGVHDALKDIERDMLAASTVRDIPSHVLEAELARREERKKQKNK